MASVSVSKAVLYVVNIVYALGGAALACAGAWFYVHLSELVAFVDNHQYYMHFRLAWVQVVPWLLIATGLVLIFAACCGCCSANTDNKGVLLMYIVFLAVTILAHVLVAILVFTYVGGADTDDFITEVLVNAFTNAKNSDSRRAFEAIERKYYCCGARDPNDYKNWEGGFPRSCCDDDAAGSCQATNSRAYARQGCAVVATLYAKLSLKYMAVGAVFVAFCELVGLFVALSRYRKLRRRSMPRHEDTLMSESKKVLI